jgi:hypothetical protein
MFWLSDLALPPVEQLVQDQCLVPAELDNDVVVSCWMHALIMTDLPHPLMPRIALRWLLGDGDGDLRAVALIWWSVS